MADRGRRRVDPVTLLVSATVVVPLAVVVRADTVPDAERAVSEAVNGLPGWLEPGMYVGQLGGLVGVPIGLAGLAFALRRARLAVAPARSPAVFLFRGATFWLPILPGWLALHVLRRTGAL